MSHPSGYFMTQKGLWVVRLGVDPASFQAAQRIGLAIDHTVMVRIYCSEGDILEVWATEREMVMTTTKII